MRITKIIQYFLFIIIPVSCMFITPYALWSIPIPLGVLIFSFVKECNYKSNHTDSPYLGYHFLMLRKIKSFKTIDGTFYYTFHSSDERKDIIRLFRKKGLMYVLCDYQVFYNDKSEFEIGEILKELYISTIEGKAKENRYNINVEYIGTDEELISLKRSKNLKTILGDE